MFTRKPRILITDDTPDNIQIFMELLRDDYAIGVATSGARALAAAAKEPRPDIILLDVLMPGRSPTPTTSGGTARATRWA